MIQIKIQIKYRSLFIYQNLLKLHKESGNIKALNSVNLERLRFINEHFKNLNSNYYIEALKEIKDE